MERLTNEMNLITMLVIHSIVADHRWVVDMKMPNGILTISPTFLIDGHKLFFPAPSTVALTLMVIKRSFLLLLRLL